ncbi:ATP-binding cassette domain-containing protein [Thermostilla marina]
MEPQVAIEFDAVSFAYRKARPVLRGAQLSVPRGSFCTLLGANGSGKTTVLKLAAGLLTPREGSIRLGGENVSKMDPAARCRRLGFLFQNPGDQLFGLTVEDDVAFGPRNLGLAHDEIVERTRTALAMVGASHLLRRSIDGLSFGEQRRAALAGVLAMQPEILLLDEVTAGLDPRGEIEILRLLVSLSRRCGMTLVLATHSIDTVPLVADVVAVLHDGRFQAAGTPAEILGRVDLLERAGLRPPYITQCFDRFFREADMKRRPPLTVEEGISELHSLFGNRRADDTTPVCESERE